VTPISSPRFSKQNTCSTAVSAPSSLVRSAQASTTVRTRAGVRLANEALWSAVKQTTSQRPAPGRVSVRPGRSGGPTSDSRWLNEGKRFSNTTTS